MKKIISIVLVTLMLLACMPLSFLAAGVSDTDVAKIGDTGYATLDAAITAVQDGQTIVLLKDAELSALNTNAIDYTIDGQNKTYTVRTTKQVRVGNGNVTFKDLKLVISGENNNEILIGANDNGDITLDGCTFITNKNKSINHQGKGNVTFKNTTVESYDSTSCIFFLKGNHANVKDDECVWTIEDSEIINYTGSSTMFENTSIFCIGSTSTADTAYKFNLKGNTVIKNASKTQNVTCGVTLFAINSSKGSFEINADPTVKLVLAAENVTTNASSYFYTAKADTVTPKIILNGTPEFIASPKVVAVGVEMPDIVHKDGAIRYTNTWSDDGGTTTFITSIDKGTVNPYKADVTQDVTFTPINVGLTAGSPNVYGVRKFDGEIEYYSTLSEAKFRTRAGESLVLLRDYNMINEYSQEEGNTHANFFAEFMADNRVKNYTVEGITKADGSKVNLIAKFNDLGDRQITFKNLEIQFGAEGDQFDNRNSIEGTGVMTLDNCNVTAKKGINIIMAVTFNVINSKLTSTHDSCMFWIAINNDSTEAKATINIENSHLIYEGKGTGDAACLFDYNTQKPVVINVKGNSTLEWKGTGSTNAHIAWEYTTPNKCTINMDDSIVVYLNPQNGAATNGFFFGTTANNTMKITGNPTYKVNDTAAKNGFSFYKSGSSIVYGNNETILGYEGKYTNNSNAFLPNTGNVLKLAQGFSVKPITFGADDFNMLDGAAIRTKDGRGIRFSTYVSNALLDKLNGRTTSFGTLIAHNDRLTASKKSFTLEAIGNDSSIAINISSTKEKWQESGDNKLFRAALVGFPNTADAFNTNFASKAYMTVTYDGGLTETFYTGFNSDKNVRSMYQVATNLKTNPNLAGDALEVVNYIINTVTAGK